MNSTAMIRIFIIAQNLLTCDTLATAIKADKTVHVVGQSTTVADALSRLEGCDLVLIEAAVPAQKILQLADEVHKYYPRLKTVLVGIDKPAPMLLDYFEAGISGYILADDTVETFIEKIKAVHQGKPVICPEMTAALMVRLAELSSLKSGLVSGVTKKRLATLTSREREILQLIARNLTNREIGEQLFIEIGTVKNHIHSILRKLNVHSRHDAAAYLQATMALERYQTKGNDKADQGEKYESVERFLEPA